MILPVKGSGRILGEVGVVEMFEVGTETEMGAEEEGDEESEGDADAEANGKNPLVRFGIVVEAIRTGEVLVEITDGWPNQEGFFCSKLMGATCDRGIKKEDGGEDGKK
jgi:hypothetical protein